MLKTRLSTAAIALPAVLAAVIFAPNLLFTFIIAVLGAWGLYEIAEMTRARNVRGIATLLIAGAAPLIALLFGPRFGWKIPGAVFVVMILLIIKVARLGSEGAPKGVTLALIGAAWVGFLFPYFALLRNGQGGIALIVMMLLLVIASDTGAYFSGMTLGRTLLVPKVSPKKTVEGAVGGLLASIIAGLILRPWLEPGWEMARTVVISASIAILAQLGDLAGSAVKRQAGVKESGWIFPGHGGLLDRTCSLVFAAVFTYYCAR